MIVVRVELHSAVSPDRSRELARLIIANDETGGAVRRNYIVQRLYGRDRVTLDKRKVISSARVENWPAERLHVWNLVTRALINLGLDKQ